MELFFVSLKTISFLSLKQMFDTDVALYGKPIYFPKFVRFIYYLLKVNFIGKYIMYKNNI